MVYACELHIHTQYFTCYSFVEQTLKKLITIAVFRLLLLYISLVILSKKHLPKLLTLCFLFIPAFQRCCLVCLCYGINSLVQQYVKRSPSSLRCVFDIAD